MSSKIIAITGGTGFVGRHIGRKLAGAGHSVTIFSRTARASKDGVRYAGWNPAARQIDAAALQDVDAVIHLAGAGVADKRWTSARKREIIDSRVAATYFLHEQIAAYAPKCAAFIAASATGYYGPDRDGLEPFREDAPPYVDFLANVCKDWEAASLSAKEKYRTAIMRTGIVLGKDGGAYPELSGPMKLGIMPILGSGRQMVSWIHVDDLAQLYIDAVMEAQYSGVYNAVAPNPVTHRVLMQTIAKGKGGIKIPAPIPAFALHVIMGDASVEVLKSCTVSCEKLEREGFQFRYLTIGDAVASIVGKV